MNHDIITLDESSTKCIGKSLIVSPVYGWGWGWSGPQPEPFSLLLNELCRDDRGNIRGGAGQIISQGHHFEGFWVLFTLRYFGQWDFHSNRGHYNVCIYKSPPPTDSSKFITDGHLSTISRDVVTYGYAIIGLPYSRTERIVRFKQRLAYEIPFCLLAAPLMMILVLIEACRFHDQPRRDALGFFARALCPRLLVGAIFWSILFAATYQITGQIIF